MQIASRKLTVEKIFSCNERLALALPILSFSERALSQLINFNFLLLKLKLIMQSRMYHSTIFNCAQQHVSSLYCWIAER